MVAAALLAATGLMLVGAPMVAAVCCVPLVVGWMSQLMGLFAPRPAPIAPASAELQTVFDEVVGSWPAPQAVTLGMGGDGPPEATSDTIIVPPWLQAQPPQAQAWILAHELTHVRLGDYRRNRALVGAVLGASAVLAAVLVVGNESVAVGLVSGSWLFACGQVVTAGAARAAERRADSGASSLVGALSPAEGRRLLWRPAEPIEGDFWWRIVARHPAVSERLDCFERSVAAAP